MYFWLSIASTIEMAFQQLSKRWISSFDYIFVVFCGTCSGNTYLAIFCRIHLPCGQNTHWKSTIIYGLMSVVELTQLDNHTKKKKIFLLFRSFVEEFLQDDCSNSLRVLKSHPRRYLPVTVSMSRVQTSSTLTYSVNSVLVILTCNETRIKTGLLVYFGI